jgi:Subtilase family
VSACRGLLATVAVTCALAAAGPASAIEMSLRSPFLPPVDGTAPAQAFSLARQGRELIVAVERDKRAVVILREHGARRLGELLWLVPGTQSAAAVDRLDAMRVLRYAHANGRLRRSAVLAARGDPVDPEPWWLPQIGATSLTAPAAGFPLTIIDDGIDTTHPEFVSRPIRFLNENDMIPQEDFHGTMVSSVAAAPLDGVGIVGLYPLANLRSSDTGFGNCADVLAAVEAAISAGPSVINMSWGFSPPSCLALHDQLIRALATGSLSVSATGNMRLHFSAPAVPAMWPHVLTTGSTNSRGMVSYFSTEGQGIDLAAPGESMIVAAPPFVDATGYADVDGTSFAAALVSATAAWVATRRPMQATQLAELLRSSARDTGPPGWDEDTGFGILDIPAALRRRLPAVDPLEPNDDVNQVAAGGLFKDAATPLTRPGRATATLRARLDRSEDPVDVYRVYVPGRRVARLRVVPTSNVDLEVFRPSTGSCYYQNRRRALRAALIGGSYEPARAEENFALENARESGRYVYACVYKPRDAEQRASYTLSIRTTALRQLPSQSAGKDKR